MMTPFSLFHQIGDTTWRGRGRVTTSSFVGTSGQGSGVGADLLRYPGWRRGSYCPVNYGAPTLTAAGKISFQAALQDSGLAVSQSVQVLEAASAIPGLWSL